MQQTLPRQHGPILMPSIRLPPSQVTDHHGTRSSARSRASSSGGWRQLDVKTAVSTQPRLVDIDNSSSSSRRPRFGMGHEQHSIPRHSSSHPVLHVMHQRLQEGSSSRAGCRRDGCKLGLVVEGGGMRGIVTGAMLMGLADMGLGANVFDAVYGASAGAINATYYLSRQPAGLDIYADHLAVGNRFLSLKRYWSSQPVMDLNFLLDEVMADTIPLDYQAVIDSDLPLKVVASSLTTLSSEILTDFKDRRDLAECLKASANVPVIVGGPRRWRGHDLVDAAVFEPLPIKAALRDGCTHVLALCSRTHTGGPAWGKYVTSALSSAIKYMVLNPPYMREAWRVEPKFAQHKGQQLDDLLVQLLMHGRALELDAAIDKCSKPLGSSPGLSPTSSMEELVPGQEAMAAAAGLLAGHVFPVYPGPAAAFSPVCTNVETLNGGRFEGYRAINRLMSALATLEQPSMAAGGPSRW
eukprot:GHRQ01001868.1.p1 GENE.GHRQ01001868.1~~GHRQ01001868.1.p1  ORF type:complete len:467 (+),score=178.06 GHRQ01001868.1:470-1870(+)